MLLTVRIAQAQLPFRGKLGLFVHSENTSQDGPAALDFLRLILRTIVLIYANVPQTLSPECFLCPRLSTHCSSPPSSSAWVLHLHNCLLGVGAHFQGCVGLPSGFPCWRSDPRRCSADSPLLIIHSRLLGFFRCSAHDPWCTPIIYTVSLFFPVSWGRLMFLQQPVL